MEICYAITLMTLPEAILLQFLTIISYEKVT
jgi:hypothetical protein